DVGVLPVPHVEDHLLVLGRRILRLRGRPRRRAEQQAAAALRERRRRVLADPPALRDPPRAGRGHDPRGVPAFLPGIERVRRLLRLVVVAIREEGDLPAGPVEDQPPVLALACQQRGRPAGGEVEDVDAVALAVARRNGVGEPPAVAREPVRVYGFDPPLLARLQVTDDERRAFFLAPLAAPRPLGLSRLLGLAGGLARSRAVWLRACAVLPRLPPEPVGEPAAGPLGQREIAEVRDAHDRARAQGQDAERVPWHVGRPDALHLRLLDRRPRRLEPEDDETAIRAELARLTLLDADGLGRAGGELLDDEDRVP